MPRAFRIAVSSSFWIRSQVCGKIARADCPSPALHRHFARTCDLHDIICYLMNDVKYKNRQFSKCEISTELIFYAKQKNFGKFWFFLSLRDFCWIYVTRREWIRKCRNVWFFCVNRVFSRKLWQHTSYGESKSRYGVSRKTRECVHVLREYLVRREYCKTIIYFIESQMFLSKFARK